MINHVVLVGRITRDPELRRTSNGTAVCSFDLAIDRKTGADKEKITDFISCQAWRYHAEAMEKYVKKGQLLAIEGTIQNRSYDGKDGKKVYITEVIVTSLTLTEFNKKDDFKPSTIVDSKSTISEPTFDVPEEDTTFEITEDDLPF